MRHLSDCICDECFEPWLTERRRAKTFHAEHGTAYWSLPGWQAPNEYTDCLDLDQCGTASGYRRHGCRGDACRDAKNAEQRAWRQTTTKRRRTA